MSTFTSLSPDCCFFTFWMTDPTLSPHRGIWMSNPIDVDGGDFSTGTEVLNPSVVKLNDPPRFWLRV